jgi:cell division protein FtsZ
MVFGVGGAGCNAVNNMIQAGLQGCDFVVANTDAQSLNMSKSERIIQMGIAVTEGLGAGSQPDVGRAAAEEVIDEIADHLSGSHMVFITAGMGGGTGTGSAPVVARTAREQGILTVGVVTKPFHFEGQRRLALAERGIEELSQHVDTLEMRGDHVVHRIGSGAANSDHGDPWPELMRHRHAQVNGHSFLTPPPLWPLPKSPFLRALTVFGSGSKVS